MRAVADEVLALVEEVGQSRRIAWRLATSQTSVQSALRRLKGEGLVVWDCSRWSLTQEGRTYIRLHSESSSESRSR